jgi:hypothetical protein
MHINIKKLQHFFNNTMIKLGFHGWKLKFVSGSEGYCWLSRRIIEIGIDSWNPQELILHEISHIGICRFCNNKHNFDFWNRFGDLMRRFLPSKSWSGESLLHQTFTGAGFYHRVYEK